ncbi:hypothetical protein FIBSPDRAFT_931262 [Athelia psychrophila]|uniref:Uncharacterized protein n=1 Tax=Athelia psychrophila TaxID=1759441 RepID=A0A166KUV8_9AGAM|nr:hypothetical protein FIBSPDRAFT_931262 [Fibularhizoctonia sp. CBS 109695]
MNAWPMNRAISERFQGNLKNSTRGVEDVGRKDFSQAVHAITIVRAIDHSKLDSVGKREILERSIQEALDAVVVKKKEGDSQVINLKKVKLVAAVATLIGNAEALDNENAGDPIEMGVIIEMESLTPGDQISSVKITLSAHFYSFCFNAARSNDPIAPNFYLEIQFFSERSPIGVHSAPLKVGGAEGPSGFGNIWQSHQPQQAPQKLDSTRAQFTIHTLMHDGDRVIVKRNNGNFYKTIGNV